MKFVQGQTGLPDRIWVLLGSGSGSFLEAGSFADFEFLDLIGPLVAFGLLVLSFFFLFSLFSFASFFSFLSVLSRPWSWLTQWVKAIRCWKLFRFRPLRCPRYLRRFFMGSETEKPVPGEVPGGEDHSNHPGSSEGSPEVSGAKTPEESRSRTLMKSFPFSGPSRRYICLHQVSERSLACLNHRHAYEVWEGGLRDLLYTRVRLRAYRKVKVPAFPVNVPLILALYEMKLRDELLSLQVCSPTLVGGRNWRKLSSEEILQRAVQAYFSPSCGGFHEFTELDYPAYALRVMSNPHSDSGFRPEFDADTVRYFVELHPLYFLSVSLPHLHFLDLASLIAEILDPRFFVDIYHTERFSKLYSYFGLFPENIRRILDGRSYSYRSSAGRGDSDQPGTWTGSEGQSVSSEPALPSAQDEPAELRYLRRCQLVYDCVFSMVPNDSQEEAPQFFLWREQRRFGGGVKGTLRALQKFLQFVAMIWKDQLYKRSNSWKEPLFVPEYFFHSSDEVSWFRSLYN